MNYQFHRAAQDEHLGNIGFYESLRAGLGARYLADFESIVARICEAPHRFRLERQPSIRTLALRTFPFFVIYRTVGEVVQILAIAHFRRRPGYWASRL